MRWHRSRGLRFEILGNLGLVWLMALLLTGLGVWLINGRQMLEQSLSHGTALVRDVASEILAQLPRTSGGEYFATPEGAALLGQTLARARNREPHLSLMLVDPLFRVLGALPHRVEPGDTLEDPTLAIALARGDLRTQLEGKAPFLGYFHRAVTTLPLMRDGEVVGGLVAELSLAEVLRSARQTVFFMLVYVGVGSLVLLLLGAILISRTLVRPLENTLRAVRSICNGNPAERIPPAGDNEMGELVDTFNDMAEDLQRKQAAIDENVKVLKQMNRMLNQSQKEVIQSEKLASVGLLAAGVAHEVGNPLSAVLGYMDILIKGVDDPGIRQDYLTRVESEVLRIHRIVKDLREYSRPSPGRVRTVHLEEVIRETVEMVRVQGEFQGVAFRVEIQPGLPGVCVDDRQFQQVLVNLFLNAKDAMDGRGKIRLRAGTSHYLPPRERDAGGASCRRDDPPSVDFRLLRKNHPAGRWPFMEGQELVVIDVTDEGEGIRDEWLARVFDPFFTTKGAGKGTGLGLSVSQRIIESFYGDIRVRSRHGEGTTVRICLPVAEEEPGASIQEFEESAGYGTARSGG